MKINSTVAIALAILGTSPLFSQNRPGKGKESPADQFEREHLGNVPVALHGRVVDQDNQPIAGVVVRLAVEVGYMRTPSQGETRWDGVELTTNPNGTFSLPSRKAGSISVHSVVKDGYEASAKNPRRFDFFRTEAPRHHVPDPQNPVVFRMWKLHGAEPMIYARQTSGIPCDGSSTNFDVFTGLRTSTNRNFVVAFTRSPLHPTKGQRFDSVLRLEIIGGGIMATDDEFTNLAPGGGYEPSVTIEQKANDPVWNRSIARTFYVRTREGYYGVVKIDLATFFDPPPTHFAYEAVINPSGSRVLEYDSVKRIIPGKAKEK